jgi:hypothetical protein
MLPGITPALFSGGVKQTRTLVLADTGAVRSWTVPSDWTSENSVECIGAGAGGLGGVNGQSGGGGGAYAKSVNLSLTPGAVISYRVGTGGNGSTTTTGNAGGDTWFNGAAFPASGQACGAKGSPAAVRNAVGPGGSAASCYAVGTGNLKFSGGSGGPGVDTTNNCGAGGGGAGGPFGNGGNGATAGSPGGGGGGNGGGTAGNASGNGGNNAAGTGGGVPYNGSPGNPGTVGGGGAGGQNSGNIAVGGAGGPGTDIVTGFLGGGGGGGGGWATGVSNATQGGNAGNYGGGGGGAGQRISATGTGGHGAQGIIVVKYKTSTPVADPDWRVKLLLHMEGAQGGNVFLDSSPFNKPMVQNNNYNTTLAQKKFGSSSGVPGAGNSYLYPNDSPGNGDFSFGQEDFTIDLWAWLINSGVAGMFYDGRPGFDGPYPTIYNNTSNIILFHTNGAAQITGPAFTLNTWTHIALVRASSVTRLYVNGTQYGVNYPDTNRYMNFYGARPLIGNDGMAATNAFSGYLDEVRVSRGVARWLSNFSPPTAPYTP